MLQPSTTLQGGAVRQTCCNREADERRCEIPTSSSCDGAALRVGRRAAIVCEVEGARRRCDEASWGAAEAAGKRGGADVAVLQASRRAAAAGEAKGEAGVAAKCAGLQ